MYNFSLYNEYPFILKVYYPFKTICVCGCFAMLVPDKGGNSFGIHENSPHFAYLHQFG